ncbi:MAG: glutamine--fructose-6-phosphate transaminase (isomerizing) [Patescibacteria group bacterium]|jgi:glucosamine--fructose-6-phosphate aminotransferase (isomerizing)
MCGIIGYIGPKPACPILLEGLKRLEYRGYDSAGLVILNPKATLAKAAGRVAVLAEKVGPGGLPGQVGIAHTRWATHGEPNEVNAHPHTDCHGEIFIAHNGIIENYKELRDELRGRGHQFKSQTDSEVVAHLIEENYQGNLEAAVLASLKKVRGTYGLAIVSEREPQKIVVARQSSPLLIGVGADEYFVASDVSALLGYTRQVIYLNDGEVAVLTPGDFKILTLDNQRVDRACQAVEWSLEESQKGGYAHFMLKEIMAEPDAIINAIRGRYIKEEGLAKLGGLEIVAERLRQIKRLIIVSCGTSYYAGLVGEYMIEEYAGLPVEVEYASEFRYRKPLLDQETAVLAISQSGETADTLAAIQEAKRKGALTLGLVNVIGSTIARETDAGVYNHAGPEIGVASTKAFVSQLALLALLTVFFGRQREMSLVTGKRILEELEKLPELLRGILTADGQIKAIAEKYKNYRGFLYVGRKYNFPVACEGALKLKEISYIHAEGYPAGEMKHGPIALIDEDFPVVAITPEDSVYEKNLSNLQEIKARRGKIIAVATAGDESIRQTADEVIYIPKTLEMLTPILAIGPLHLLAYQIAASLGRDVDKPRNLAKSVTVE